MKRRPPLGTLLLRDSSDWDAMTAEQIVEMRDRGIRAASSRGARLITGFADPRAVITEETISLPGRSLTLRVHRPHRAHTRLPLILSFHGGGFIAGTAVQNDWLNSRVAARVPAVVASVEYRLSPQSPLPQPIEDGFETLTRMVDDAASWGIDPTAVAVMGESVGGMIAALIALRARAEGPTLRAQVLNYPSTDWTATMLDYPSASQNAGNPTLPLSRLRAGRRLSVPSGFDAAAVSPLKVRDLVGLPPALIITAGLDPLEDHGRGFAARLREDGTKTCLLHYPRATHTFLSTPALVPAARPARREIIAFLRTHLARDCERAT